MKDTIKLLKDLDLEISKLEKIIKDDTYTGSGISFGISQGKFENKYTLNIGLGISSLEETKEILRLILIGLNKQRKFFVNCLENELNEANQYLENDIKR
jgi:hypothetical protein